MRKMTPRERIEAVLQGRPVDRVPFTAYEGMPVSVPEVQDFLGADAIGFTRWSTAHTIEYPNCAIEVEDFEEGGARFRRVVTKTPAGRLMELYRFDPTYGSLWHMEFPIKGPRDYDAYVALLDDAVLKERYGDFQAEADAMGESGLPMASVGRSPYQRLAIEAVGLMNLGLHLADFPAKVERAMEAIRRVWREAVRIAAASPALIVNIPDNINAPMVGLERFRKYCAPLYNEAARTLEGTGKVLMVHMDGSLRPLREAVGECRHRVVESLCCRPDGDISVEEAVRWWPDKVFWVNFPSSVHLSSPEIVRATARQILEEGAESGRILMGLMENVPPFAWRRSLPEIAQAIRDYGEPSPTASSTRSR